jgi:hypothetical protein
MWKRKSNSRVIVRSIPSIIKWSIVKISSRLNCSETQNRLHISSSLIISCISSWYRKIGGTWRSRVFYSSNVNKRISILSFPNAISIKILVSISETDLVDSFYIGSNFCGTIDGINKTSNTINKWMAVRL